jgi:hypothetical protein
MKEKVFFLLQKESRMVRMVGWVSVKVHKLQDESSAVRTTPGLTGTVVWRYANLLPSGIPFVIPPYPGGSMKGDRCIQLS